MGTDSTLYQVVLVLHVLAAVVWVGGLLFIPTVLVPVASGLDDRDRRWLFDAVGRQFRLVGWSALAVSLTTGSYMLYHWGASWSGLVDLSFFDSPHTRTLGYKLLVVAAMLVVSGLHDWWLGPVASDPDTRSDSDAHSDALSDAHKETSSLRTWARWLGRAAALLGILVVVLATSVARPWL